MSCLLRICGHSFSWALFTFLLLGHVQALAEWVALDAHHQSHGLQTVYIDLSTLRRDGQLATMVTLIDWKWMQGLAKSRPDQAIVNQIQVSAVDLDSCA